jgi:hypothetical protein
MASEPPQKKVMWADIDDEDELPIPVVISKHGIKVQKQKPYVPPHQRLDKNSKRIEGKKDAS